MITAQIKKDRGGLYVVVRDPQAIKSLICILYGDNYTVRRTILSQYEIIVRRNSRITGILDVDDYTCETWKKVQ